jgi:RNA polymerase sigma-70 factor (ECF subfamily)
MLPSRATSTGRDRSEDSSAPDERLVERARAGDRDAEEAIYRRHVVYLAGMILRLVGSAVEAEDVLHDTFVLALQELPRLRAGTALRPWLARIAVSQVHRRFRRRRLLRVLGMDGGEIVPLDSIASAQAGPEVRAQLAALGRVLGALPVEQRIAWSLRFIEGSTLEEVADACGCSLATAKRRVQAASERVQRSVDVEDPGPLPLVRKPGARGTS